MSTSVMSRRVEILLVEDNPGDIRLTREALKEAKVVNRLHTVTDGAEAIAYLRREKGYEDAVRPDLILLDLNLPRKDGKDVLAEIKSDPDLKRTPVVVLTTSQAEEDILRSYNLHANCFISKPVEITRFLQVLQAIDQFWFSIVSLRREN